MALAQRRREIRVRLATTLLALAAGAVADVALADLKAEAPKNVNLTAIWKINPELSDDPQKVLAKRRDEENSNGAPVPRSRRGTRTSGGIDAGDIFGGVISGTID
jgi:hypothetical protein